MLASHGMRDSDAAARGTGPDRQSVLALRTLILDNQQLEDLGDHCRKPPDPGLLIGFGVSLEDFHLGIVTEGSIQLVTAGKLVLQLLLESVSLARRRYRCWQNKGQKHSDDAKGKRDRPTQDDERLIFPVFHGNHGSGIVEGNSPVAIKAISMPMPGSLRQLLNSADSSGQYKRRACTGVGCVAALSGPPPAAAARDSLRHPGTWVRQEADRRRTSGREIKKKPSRPRCCGSKAWPAGCSGRPSRSPCSAAADHRAPARHDRSDRG